MRGLRVAGSLVAGILALAIVISITGLFGASGVSVKITAPTAGAKVSGVLAVAVTVKGASKIAYAILGVDDDRPISSNAAPYAFELDTAALSDGAHRIFVEAYDNYGLLASSKVMTIYVKNGSAAPVQAKKAAPTKLASKPQPALSVAQAPQPAAKPAAPVVAARGPLPEPSHGAVSSPIASAAETGSRTSFAAAAAEDIAPAAGSNGRVRGHTLLVDGQAVRFTVYPYIESDRMHASFRGLFQQAGAKVTWHRAERLARSVRGTETVEVVDGGRTAMVNGQQVDMGSVASIRDARMMISLRFFAQVTGSELHWDARTRTADLRSSDHAVAERPLPK
jgi:hypothetical protein